MKVVRMSDLLTGNQELFLVLIDVRGHFETRAIDKVPRTQLGIELAAFLLAAFCLNQLRQRVHEIIVNISHRNRKI
jgi:hypothetical protein